MLELKHVSFEVPQNGMEKEIIKDISFIIPDGKFTVITGPNGGGKSTLARLIAGIQKPTSGQILLDGVDITEKSITERANMGISYAFQQPVRFKGVTVLDLIRLASGKEVTIAVACEYLSKVGLCAKDYINREIDAQIQGSLLIISHQERILNIADEILVIGDGQVKDHGKKEDILPKLLGSSNAVNLCKGRN